MLLFTHPCASVDIQRASRDLIIIEYSVVIGSETGSMPIQAAHMT